MLPDGVTSDSPQQPAGASTALSAEQRVVILGASNVTIGLSTIVALVTAGLPSRVRLDIAHGHGRSYGNWSRVMFRSLPGHTETRLWENVSREDPPVLALLTDIGNDIVYGADPAQIATWVEQCLERLQVAGAEIVLTGLPLDSLRSLSPARFRLFKTLFFPRHPLTLDQALTNAADLDARVAALADQFGATLIRPAGAWYGVDPIHIRRSARQDAWQTVLNAFDAWSCPGAAVSKPFGSLRLWRLRPQERRILRRQEQHSQPALDDSGIQLNIY